MKHDGFYFNQETTKANYVPINSLAIATADDPAIVTFISEIEIGIPLPKQSTLRILGENAVSSSFDGLVNDDTTDDNVAIDE